MFLLATLYIMSALIYLFSYCFFVLGVADGVGGWRSYGIDPGEFSFHLMKTCERLVRLGRFAPTNPSELLASSYYELLHNKKAILGKYLLRFFILMIHNRSVLFVK